MKAFLLCLLIGGSGVGYVWQKDQIRQLGVQITKREMRLKQLRRENEKRRNQLEEMRSLRVLDARIRELNLGLALPSPSQVWQLKEPPREPATKPAPAQYAAHGQPIATLP